MVIVSEIAHGGEVHLQFNSCFLKIIDDLYTDEIYFRAEKAHSEAIQAIEMTDKITYIPFEKYYDTEQYSWLSRVFGEIKQVINSLKIGKELNARIYIWTCLLPTGQLFLNLISRLYNNDKIHIIVLHGELEMIKNKRGKITKLLLGYLLKFSFFVSARTTKFIVLGDSIKNHLSKKISSKSLRKVISILHPYDYSKPNFTPVQLSKNKLIYGTIGTLMVNKNSQNLFLVASYFKNSILAGEIEFRAIGKVLTEIEPFRNELVSLQYSDSFVPQYLFEKAIKEMDFVLFFYDNNSYQLCASGAIFEIIKLGIISISITNDYFEWLFNKYGRMGFLCKDMEAMKVLIEGISTGKYKAEIEIMKDNIRSFKIDNGLSSITRKLSEFI
ncbi:hypothetical protein [Pedobacter sp. MR2016-24]|uniref:hypothetical protein n=1 Tax=Pedobacter sp. MR2016-24 TaxID=2994466 RepID=UPI0022480CEB|nr:hypothetical protein [Pedobacter sp. MR2016-24]MCX2485260.1 hypothetical protein [Pedobacter sp. MR2016-24]